MLPCVKSELDLFRQKPIQTSITENTVVGYKPLSSANATSLEFVIPKSSEVYRDLSSVFLKLNVKLTGTPASKVESGVSVVQEKLVGPVNNLLHSLFSQVQVFLNGVNLSQGGDNYGYRAYFETLLSYGQDAAKTHLTQSMFYLDTGNMLADETNTGFSIRMKKLGKTCELLGRLHGDLFSSSLLMGVGTEIKIRLTRASNAFTILSTNDSSNMGFEITDATLFMKNVIPSPSVVLAHHRTLAMGATLNYHIDRVEIKSHTIPQNERSCSLDNIIIGTLPKSMVIAFTDNFAFSGKSSLNPFNLKHFDYEMLNVKVNGVNYPSESLTADWKNDMFSRSYQTLFSETHIKHGYQTNLITPELYANGYHLVVFDLTPDSSSTEVHSSVPKQGSVRIDVKFAKELPNAISVIVMSIYDSVIQVDKSGNVLLDY